MAAQPSKKEITIVLIGRSGVGKSTLLLNLVGEALPRTSISADPDTTNLQCKIVEEQGAAIKIIDTPGMWQYPHILKQMKKEYNIFSLDLLIYCISVAPNSSYQHDQAKMRYLQQTHGKQIWKHCIVVFTFSNIALNELAKSWSEKKTLLHHYNTLIHQSVKNFKEELEALDVTNVMSCNLFSEIDFCNHNIIPAITAGYFPDEQVLPGHELHGKRWRDEILNVIFKKSMGKEPFPLYSASFFQSILKTAKTALMPFEATTKSPQASSDNSSLITATTIKTTKTKAAATTNTAATTTTTTTTHASVIKTNVATTIATTPSKHRTESKAHLTAHMKSITKALLSADSSTTESKEFVKDLENAVKKGGKIDRKLAQIMFIGPNGSGKTSLMYRLIKRKKSKVTSSTGIADSVIPIDGFYAVTASEKTNWEEVDYDASLLRQLEADEDSGELKIKYNRYIKADDVRQSPQQSTATYGTRIESVMEEYGGYTKFKKFFTKSYSLYMRDTGGQDEFQEMVSLLVFGPSIFIFVFRAYLDLKSKFPVEYRKNDTEPINSYTSSITMEEALLQSLASVYAMKTSGGASVQKHKARVLIVATHKDKLGLNAANRDKRKIMFTVNNTAESDDFDFETIRSRVHGIISDNSEFTIEYPVSYLLFCLELQSNKKSILSLDEFRTMAKMFGIIENQVKNLLDFLHLRIGIIQYYDIEGVRHIVIKEPQVFFNTVTNLIVGTFKGDTPREAEEIEKGILSKSTLQRMISSKDIFTPEELLKLLVHLHIAAPFRISKEKEERYFLPCVLKHVSESAERKEESEVMQLAVKFEHHDPLFKYLHCPNGLFGVLVTHLMAHNSKTANSDTKLALLPNKLYKDQVSFRVDSCGVCDEITLKFHSTHYFYQLLSRK